MPKSPSKSQKRSLSSPYPPSSSTKRPAASSAAGPYRFDFGTHDGKTLLEVPPSYIAWIQSEGIDKKRPALKKAIAAYMKTPPATDSQSETKPPRRNPAQVLAQREQAVRDSMPAWLFDECWNALEATRGGTTPGGVGEARKQSKKWLDVMEQPATIEFFRAYPVRPLAELAKTSRSAKKLREMLARSPVVRGLGIGMMELSPDEQDCVEVERHKFTGEITGWTWSKEYTKEVKKCLTAAKREHGEDGWICGIWEVRDAYASCIGGITCEKKGVNKSECYTFHDQSLYWLKSLPK
ncbi:hypothetical protein WG66_012011 [Moniliophthora roreri]|uniref:Uncharacterized protein n=1 Tax=Moniliophthora roreri TaxID=221103 RepID=A0A0W0GAX0_MONRR|nr:hypothetical protein WG66_012011 [Moniliophthora roreri]